MGDIAVPVSDAAVAETSREQPVVQFAASTFYVREGEQLKVAVQRLGHCMSTTSSVDWATNSSPYEGKKFRACVGTLTFGPGELFKEFEVPLIDDDHFGSALQFRLELSNPTGCSLGAHCGDVMMQDNDVFPTNRYKEKIEQDRSTVSWQKGESWNMFKEFAKFIFRHTPGSKKVLISDQVDNVIFFIEIVVMRILVNVLSTREAGGWISFMRQLSGNQNKGPSESQELHATIIILGLVLLLPHVITHWLMYKRTTWKVTGGARAILQENLLRKYLSQDEAKAFAPTASFLDSFGHDVGDLVVNGYNKLFAVAKSIGRLLIAFALTMVLAVEEKVNKDIDLAFMAFLPFLVLPIFIIVLLVVRHHANLKALARTQNAEDELLHKVDKATESYRMVVDMESRGAVVSDCLENIVKLNSLLSKLAGLMANNRSAVHWVTEMLLVLWIAIGGNAVAAAFTKGPGHSKELDLGSFLAVLSLIRANGTEFENLCEVWLSLQTNYPALWNLVALMNVGSDLEERLCQQRARLSHGKASVEHVHKVFMPTDLNRNEFPEDCMPLILDNINFAYPKTCTDKAVTRCSSHMGSINSFSQHTAGDMLFDNLSHQFQQGSLIAITGPRRSGKSTTLKLVGGVLLPVAGTISIPPYLRILHVTSETTMWRGTVAENIFFGVCASLGMKTDDYATLDRQTLERGWHVCRVLNFPTHLQKLAEDLTTTQELNLFTLAASHAKLIHLARAFIADPEVLVVHEPTFFLAQDLSRVVMEALAAFVKLRGLVPDDQRQQSRRPRTVFFSSADQFALAYADRIVKLAAPKKLNKHFSGDIAGSAMV